MFTKPIYSQLALLRNQPIKHCEYTMTREEMEDQIISDIENWDVDALLSYVEYNYREQFYAMNDEEIADRWDSICGTDSEVLL